METKKSRSSMKRSSGYSIYIAILLAFASHQVAPTLAHGSGLLGGLGEVAGSLTGGMGGPIGQMTNSLLSAPMNLVNQAVPGVLNSVTKPLMGALGGVTSPLSNLAADVKIPGLGDKTLSNGLAMVTGSLDGFTTGGGAALGLSNSALAGASNAIDALGEGLRHPLSNVGQALGNFGNIGNLAHLANPLTRLGGGFDAGMGLRNNYKREALASGYNSLASGAGAATTGAAIAAGAEATRLGQYGSAANVARGLHEAATLGAAAEAANNLPTGAALSAPSIPESLTAAANQLISRPAIAAEAIGNAQAESAIAGADMVAHGTNNARSASLASNAYRQAKLASARDRVNIAGTIQNSARISDAAIATHDASTKAEDSLLGSEIAVDSAATVLDSDAAYIPPVTSSLLRSLPYGRLGIRNIVPKPLTYPSVLLPDVWLNGQPVNYLNVPFRMMPYGIGSPYNTNTLQASGYGMANGVLINGQPYLANNGLLLNGMLFDPTTAYLASNINGPLGSSVFPILANGQLEAQDEVATANAIGMQQLTGAGMAGTYHGFGRSNPIPLLTGSVTEANLTPTTNIGTTYPVGSALVVEPRDAYFQDYVDNASSRQNFDERQQ